MDNSISVLTENAPKATKTYTEKEFELAVYDITENEQTGKLDLVPVRYDQPVIVKVKSPKELKERLATFLQCNQVAKVVRELTSKTISVETGEEVKKTLPILHSQQILQPVVQQPQIVQLVVHSALRFFKLGDIEVKEDNGVFYQKQWMRLTESESANFRIVNNKNNATVNLANKHIEMKKWVRVENSTETDDTSKLLENLEC